MPAFLSVPQDAYPEPPDGASDESEEARIVPLRPTPAPGPPPPLPVDLAATEIVIRPKPPLPVPEPVAAEVVEPVAAEHIEHPDPFAASVVLDESVPDVQQAALVLRGVTKTFGDTRAVDGVDLTVPAGTFYGLVGPNGAGKTTTLSLIAGLLRHDKGSIRVGDINAAADPVGAKRLM